MQLLDSIGFPESLVISVTLMLVTLMLLWDLGKLARTLEDAVDTLRGGGPRSPSHTLPSDDSALLNRGRRRVRRQWFR